MCHYMPNPNHYHPTLETMLDDSGLLTTPLPLRRLQEASIKNGLPYEEGSLSRYDYMCARQFVFGLLMSETPGADPEEDIKGDWTEEEENKLCEEPASKKQCVIKYLGQRKCLEKLLRNPVDTEAYRAEGYGMGTTLRQQDPQREFFVKDIAAVSDVIKEELIEINLEFFCREDGYIDTGLDGERLEMPLMSVNDSVKQSLMVHQYVWERERTTMWYATPRQWRSIVFPGEYWGNLDAPWEEVTQVPPNTTPSTSVAYPPWRVIEPKEPTPTEVRAAGDETEEEDEMMWDVSYDLFKKGPLYDRDPTYDRIESSVELSPSEDGEIQLEDINSSEEWSDEASEHDLDVPNLSFCLIIHLGSRR